MAIIEKVKRIQAKAREIWRRIKERFAELKAVLRQIVEDLRQERERWRNIDTSDSRIIVYEKEEFWFDDGNGGRITFTDERGKPLR